MKHETKNEIWARKILIHFLNWMLTAFSCQPTLQTYTSIYNKWKETQISFLCAAEQAKAKAKVIVNSGT